MRSKKRIYVSEQSRLNCFDIKVFFSFTHRRRLKTFKDNREWLCVKSFSHKQKKSVCFSSIQKSPVPSFLCLLSLFHSVLYLSNVYVQHFVSKEVYDDVFESRRSKYSHREGWARCACDACSIN